jgi:hypothetical protein
VIAYKFLSPDRVGLFSGVQWPEPGTWLEPGPIHALHAEGLLDWIDDELWTCELAGIVEDDGRVVVAERGRLLERVVAWNEGTAREFARACAARGREHVSEALRAERHDGEAEELVLLAADTTALAEGRPLEARAPQLRSHLEAVADGRPSYGAIAANVAFVVAHSTAGLHPGGYDDGLAAERAWQLERLFTTLQPGHHRLDPP